jgi:hypothetical protein
VPHARALARRAGPWPWPRRGVACRVESSRDETRPDRDREAYSLFLSFMSVMTVTVTVRRIHCFCHSCRSFMSIIIFCIKTTVTGN